MLEAILALALAAPVPPPKDRPIFIPRKAYLESLFSPGRGDMIGFFNEDGTYEGRLAKDGVPDGNLDAWEHGFWHLTGGELHVNYRIGYSSFYSNMIYTWNGQVWRQSGWVVRPLRD